MTTTVVAAFSSVVYSNQITKLTYNNLAFVSFLEVNDENLVTVKTHPYCSLLSFTVSYLDMVVTP